MESIERLHWVPFFRRRWLLHTIFWVCILAVYVIFFGRASSNYLQTFVFVTLLMPITVGTTYFLTYFLVPRYFMREKYKLFALYFLYTIIGSLFLEMVVASITFVVIAQLQLSNMNPASVDIFFLLASLLMVVFFGLVLKLLRQWRQSREAYQQLMHEKLEAELRFLKTQLNPHFLFNTLNNLYYLASEKSDKAPQAILALSEILDYVLQEGKAISVPLEKELKQVENYIALELLRYDDRVHVETTIEGCKTDKNIGPMLLITLLENSFKHGVMQVAGKSWIHLLVEGRNNHIYIHVGNSCKDTNAGKGIGLENLRSQLQHLYTNTYSFSIDSSLPNQFWVHLILPDKVEATPLLTSKL
ncbi:histidine kinase [Rhodocytophaga aerolata]|uniref:Histidine kinase n=1 Tax=Rhodocytophaga aerolata TaxID=455078 RepID=A0ABT8R1A0_9BACT|nr:histidine kinase [Rhodocytophaga aerolata]MDO1445862.1 histidine kinase [Rhodocytophaga aerolata]